MIRKEDKEVGVTSREKDRGRRMAGSLERGISSVQTGISPNFVALNDLEDWGRADHRGRRDGVREAIDRKEVRKESGQSSRMITADIRGGGNVEADGPALESVRGCFDWIDLSEEISQCADVQERFLDR